MPTRFVNGPSSAGVLTGRIAVPATLAPTVRLALSTGQPVIDSAQPGMPFVPLSELIPMAGPEPFTQNVLPSGREIQTATSMIQLGSSSMFVPGDFSGGLPSSSGGQGSAIIDLIGKGIGLAGTILQRNQPAAAAAPTTVMTAQQIGGMIGRGGNLPGVTLESLQQALHPGRGYDITLTKEGKPRKLRKDGRPFKRPTMNPLNPRALRRGMKRVQRFAKIASRTISFTKRVRMKKRRR